MVHLVDSSLFVALFLVQDAHHAVATRFFNGSANVRFIVPYAVVRETATVLVYKGSKALADAFLAYVQASTNISLFADSDMEGEIHTFTGITSRISFTDCSLLHYARAGYGELLTYDKQLARLAQRNP